MAKHKYIGTPEELWKLFDEYVAWCKANPRRKEDYVGKDAMRVMRELERPLTWVGFECYLNDCGVVSSLGPYEQNEGEAYTEYLPIISRIKRYIETDQFEGATVGQYNPNIIARKLGLVEKTESTNRVITVEIQED